MAYLPVSRVDLLMRARLVAQIESIADKNSPSRQNTQIFDCGEFGLCLMTPNTQSIGWHASWFQEYPARRVNKPRIVVTVTQLDGIAKNERKRWYFALSRVGYLYCVAYENQYKPDGRSEWQILEWYRSWEKAKSSMSKHREATAIPEDWVYRAAEQKFKNRKKK